MANYGVKIFSRYKQILCGVDGDKLPPCEQDIKDVIAAWENDKSYYESEISDYERGIINIWATDTETTDDDIGVEQLQKEADAGNVKAMNLCAMAHHLIALQGKPSLEPEMVEEHEKLAIKYWQLGAENKQCEALCNLALCYLEGKYVDEDLAKAKELFKAAIKQKHPAAKKYYKDSGLDKWDEGEELDQIPLTVREAMANSRPREKKKSRKEIISEHVQIAYAKTQRTSLKDAMKAIKDSYPHFMVVDCIKHDFCYVFSLINCEDIKDDKYPKHWKYDQHHFMFNRITNEISEFSVTNRLYATELTHANFEALLSKDEAKFVKSFWSDSFFDDMFD